VVVKRAAEGHVVATAPRLPGSHTPARSLEQLMERVRKAIEPYLELEGHPLPPLSWGLRPFGLRVATTFYGIRMAEPQWFLSMPEKQLALDC
jgi:predicted RNase H-like HicB family nuclease